MLEVLFIGLSLGSILLLVALGLAITYGAMGVINMAHGEMVMIGAYVTVLSGIWLGANIFVAIPLAFIVTALIGLAIERVMVRRLYGRLLDTLLATWGVAILIQQAVRLEFGLSFFGIHIAGPRPGTAECQCAAFPAGNLHAGGSRNQPVSHVHHCGDRDTDGRDLADHVSHLDRHAGACDHSQSQNGGGLRHRRRADQRLDVCVRLRACRCRRRDDVRLQDGLSRYGHADGGRRFHGRGDGRCRQLARIGIFGRHSRRDQRTGGGGHQRHPGAERWCSAW